MTKLWGGRFQKSAESWVDEFGASIGFDQQLVLEDIEGSIAHVTMLGATGILPNEDVALIKSGLATLRQKAEAGELTFLVENEDIHLNIEKMLIDLIGPIGGKLHTGRSRNDQVATDMHLFLKKRVPEVIGLIEAFQRTIVEKAEANIETIAPGYTHLQRAQPISFAHHLMVYFWQLERDKARFQESLKRVDISPLGAGAMAGTTFPIDRHLSAELLGFSAECIGSQNYARLRFGIGNEFSKGAQVDFVLGRFDSLDREVVKQSIEKACEMIKSFCLCGIQQTMNQFN